jgi:hypothetical protein
MSDSQPVDFELWHYKPSIAGGVVACVAFLLLTLLHGWRLIRTRLWFCTPFVVGGLCMSLPLSPHPDLPNEPDS